MNKTFWPIKLKVLLILDILGSANLALIISILKGYDFIMFVELFTALTLGSIGASILLVRTRKPGWERIIKSQEIAFQQFKEKLVRDGVVDLTEDIKRAKKIPWVKEEDIKEQLLLIKNLVEIAEINGKTYAIHKETLNRLLSKLPMKDEELQRLTQAEQRVLEIAHAAGIIKQERF